MLIFNALLLIFFPYDWRQSSASRRWIRTYVAMFVTICFLLLLWQLTQNPILQLCHSLCVIALTAVFTWFELVERVIPVSLTDSPVGAAKKEVGESLWQRITTVLRDEELWRDPDLSLDMLCERVHSNKDYVSQAFRQHADTTFNDYVNRLRVDSLACEMAAHPDMNHKELYFRAGFRTKSTAFRNFQKYKGMSPTDFLTQKASL